MNLAAISSRLVRLLVALACVFLAVLALLIVLFVIVLRGQTSAVHRNQVAVATACSDTRRLLTTIVLRTVGTTYPVYKRNPEMALRIYRRALEANVFFRKNPELIDRSVRQTRDILRLADPAKCRTYLPGR